MSNKITLLALGFLMAILMDLALIRSWREWRARRRLHQDMPDGGQRLIYLRRYFLNMLYWSWFFTPLLFAMIPAWFVFFDRWFNAPLFYRTIFHAWHRWHFNQFLAYPYYFYLVFICLTLLVGFGFLQRKRFAILLDENILQHSLAAPALPAESIPALQKRVSYGLWGICAAIFLQSAVSFAYTRRLPGLEYLVVVCFYVLAFLLQEMPVAVYFSLIRVHADRVLSAVFAHVSLIILLAGLYTEAPPLGIGLMLAGVAHLNLIRHIRHLSFVFWVIHLALFLYTLGINAWWFSVIGDEYVFYRNAVWVANHLSEIRLYFFSGNSVYGTHPHLSSILQAIPISFFGSTNFSWRFSSIYLAAVSILFFYYFFQQFLSRKAATLIVLLLASSHYLITFGKIGYNNLQALFALGFILWTAGWALQSNRTYAYAVTGMAQGFCFYVFPAALYAVPLPFLLFLFYKRPFRQQVFQWGVMLGALVIAIFPLILQPEYWISKLGGTLLSQPQLFETFGFTFRYLVRNVVYAFFSPIYTPSDLHFVAVSLIDPMTGAFFLLGLSFLVWVFWNHTFVRFLLISFGYMLFIVGATHGIAVPPTTRMFMLLPWWFAFAVIGLLWFEEWIKRYGASEKMLKGIVLTVLALVLTANLYQAFPVSYRHMAQYRTFQVYFLKMAQAIWKPEGDSSTTLLFISGEPYWLSSLGELLDIYRISYQDTEWVQAYEFEMVPANTLNDPNTLILFPPPWDEGYQKGSAQVLRSLGWTPCSIAKPDGVKVFEVWYNGSTSWVCDAVSRSPFDSFKFGTRMK